MCSVKLTVVDLILTDLKVSVDTIRCRQLYSAVNYYTHADES